MTVKEFECVKRLCRAEIRLIGEYHNLFVNTCEPQLKNDLQIICASHKNHLSDLKKLLEENN